MSRSLNKVMIIGNVGKDPELKRTPSGIPVTSFILATSETWRDREGNVREHTDWHTVVAWRGLAEVIYKLVTKGSRIYIEGKIQTRSFDNKSGSRRHVVEILAENMLLLEQRRSRPGRNEKYDDQTNGNVDSNESVDLPKLDDNPVPDNKDKSVDTFLF